MKFISKQKNLKGKIVLLRLDINSNFVNGKILMSERIRESTHTIKWLKKKGAKIVIIAHQGRTGEKDCVSMNAHVHLLSVFTKVDFVSDLFGNCAEQEIKKLKNGHAILLENLRKYKEEYNLGKNKMVENLSSWCDIYVNDAFSNSHREHASMVLFPKVMKGKSYAGLLVEKEIIALKKINVKKALFILGGAKPKEDTELLGKNKVLACGLFGQVCLVSKGKKLGAQEKYLKKTIKDYNKIKKKIKNKLKSVLTPIDFGVKVSGERKNLKLEEFPSKYEIFDIGPETLKLFVKEIKKAKAIYMKGPCGDFSSRGFSEGTFGILRAISKSRAFSLIGGGHLSDAIHKSGISKKKFNHVSLSGGALLDYIAGKKLPALEALK